MALRGWFKRILMAWGALSLCSFVMALIAGVWLRSGSMEPNNSILHVVLDGPLGEAPAQPVARVLHHDTSLPLRSMTHRIRQAAADPRIAGLLLEVKTPQVGLAQIEEISRAVTHFRHSGKWSASYVETAGETGRGDGALALASQANHVILAPAGEVHLSGLRADVPFAKGVFERLHVTPHVEQRYEFKNFADTFSQSRFTEPHKVALKSLLDDMEDRLLALIAQGRRTEVNTVRNWVLQSPHSGESALTSHVVDELGYRDTALAWAEKISGHPDPLFSLADYHPPKGKKPSADVAFVALEGEINRGDGGSHPSRGDGIGSDTYAAALRQAREDGVDAALIRIDSPGGSYLASDVLRREIELMRDHNIPVVISMGNTAASGGYFMALAGDHILAEPATVTGSIGVVSVSFALREALGRFLGLTFDTYKTLPHPGDAGFLDPPTPEDKTIMARDVDRVYRDFVSKVAQARHKTYDEVHAVARGRVWTGRQALAHGLVDGLGGLDAAEAYLKRRLELPEDAVLGLRHYPEPVSTLEFVRQALSQQADTGSWLSAQARWLGPWLLRAQKASQWHAGLRAEMTPRLD